MIDSMTWSQLTVRRSYCSRIPGWLPAKSATITMMKDANEKSTGNSRIRTRSLVRIDMLE